jgi:hypothetical protein
LYLTSLRGRFVVGIRRFAGVVVGLAAVAALLSGLGPSGTEVTDVLRAPQQAVDHSGPDAVVLSLVTALGWLTWAWATLGLLLTAAGELPGTLGAVGRLLARNVLPGAARRAAALTLGIGLGVHGPLMGAPTLAADPVPASTAAPFPDTPVPDWPSSRPADPAAPPSAPPPAGGAVPDWSGGSGRDGHVVAAGECLWQIAAVQYRAGTGTEPTDAVVADAVRAWWGTNAGVIGPDPDLIHPGQLLRPPTDPSPTPESR